MTAIESMLYRWFRSAVTVDERQALIDAKLIRITSKTYGHTAATAKGLRLMEKLTSTP